MAVAEPTATRRRLGIAGLLGLAVVYLVVLQGGGLALAALRDADVDYGEFPDRASVLTAVVIPVALSIVLVATVVTVLRWWPEVVREHRRVERWVWAVPIAMVVVALVMVTAATWPTSGCRSPRRCCSARCSWASARS